MHSAQRCVVARRLCLAPNRSLQPSLEVKFANHEQQQSPEAKHSKQEGEAPSKLLVFLTSHSSAIPKGQKNHQSSQRPYAVVISKKVHEQ